MPNTAGDVEAAALLFLSLASPVRLRILGLLASEDLDAKTLGQRLGLSTANVSQHLVRLRHAGLVATHTRGTRKINSLCRSRLGDASRLIHDLGATMPPGAAVVVRPSVVAVVQLARAAGEAEDSRDGFPRFTRERAPK